MMTYDGWAAACLGEEDELDKLRDALREDIETLGVIADRLALGSRDRNTFEGIVARNRRLLGHEDDAVTVRTSAHRAMSR
jgi:hypothetical protein